MEAESCFICRKHNRQEATPPSGYIYEDEHWMGCHAPGKLGPLGTLCIESKRHFLDYAEMTEDESVSPGGVMRKIYQVTLTDVGPHFHSWLVPHRKDDPERGMKFLMRDEISESVETLSALMS